MILGALLISAALLLAAWNLVQENQGGESVDEALSVLADLIPKEKEMQTEVVLAVTDSRGQPVDWPMDENGAPMSWPLDETGKPLESVTDASGRTVFWPVDEEGAPVSWAASEWTAASDGLLPWVTDAAGITVQWPVHLKGLLWTLTELRDNWSNLVSKVSASLEQEEPDYVKNPKKEMPTSKVKGSDYIGVLEIPRLKLELPVMSSWSYPKLRKAPCRFEGSAYSGDLIIAGHNYSRHFGRLKNLVKGDTVRFTDAAGNVFMYQVSGQEKLGGTDLTRMRAGEWDMTLFTCTYGGRSRVTVRCTLVESIPAK